MCQDVFLELVRMDIDKSYEKPTKTTHGMLEQDKVGIDRIVEALQ